MKTLEKEQGRDYVPQIGKIEEYIAQIDQIIPELGGLHKRADHIIECYVTQCCKESPRTPRDLVKHLELGRVGSKLDYIGALEYVRDRILP